MRISAAPQTFSGGPAAEMNPSTSPPHLDIRRHHGRQALRDVAAPLAAAFAPPPFPGMDAEYLAEGFEGDEPGVFVAYRDGRPVAYMTYVLRDRDFRPTFGPFSIGRFPFRQLRLFGYAGEDHTHMPILDAFSKSLREDRSWHVAQFLDLPPDNPLSDYVSRGGFGGCSLTAKSYETIQLKIENNFETYLRNRFTKKTRYNLKREVRLLEDASGGQAVMQVYHSPEQVIDFLTDVERVARCTHQWQKGFTPLRVDPLVIRKLSYLAQRKRLRGYILFIRGTPAAFCHGTIRWGELVCEVVGYDPRFAKLNPGKVLLFKIIEDLHRCHAVDGLNLQGGTAAFRQVFATTTGITVDASLYRHEPYPQFLRLLAVAAEAAYRCLRPLVRPWLPHMRRIFLRRVAASAPDVSLVFAYLSWIQDAFLLES
jgi:Acetyltransferase (GNAT) domain